MKSVLVLCADEKTLDRRIAQQVDTLLSAGFHVHLALLMQGVELPTFRAGQLTLHRSTAETISVKHAPFREIIHSSPVALKGYHWLRSFTDPNRSWQHLTDGLNLPSTDSIIANDLPCLAPALRLAKTSTKVVYDAHEIYESQQDAIYSQRLSRYWLRVATQLIPKASSVITVTQQIAEHMKRRYRLDARPSVVENACVYREQATLDEEMLGRLYSLPKGQKVIACIGHLRPSRGLEALVASIPHLSSDACIAFIGPGNPQFIRSLRGLAQNLGCEQRAYFGASVSPGEVVDCAAGAYLGVITNRGQGPNYELGGPNRLYEYVQARLPTFAYAHRATSEFLAQTRTGTTATWNSPKQLAAHLDSALLNRRAIASADLEAAASAHCWEAQESVIIDAVS